MYFSSIRLPIDDMLGSDMVVFSPVTMILSKPVVVRQWTSRQSGSFSRDVSFPTISSIHQFNRFLWIIPSETFDVQTRIKLNFIRSNVNLNSNNLSIIKFLSKREWVLFTGDWRCPGACKKCLAVYECGPMRNKQKMSHSSVNSN